MLQIAKLLADNNRSIASKLTELWASSDDVLMYIEASKRQEVRQNPRNGWCYRPARVPASD